jgi:hypothetical protein
VGRTRLIWLVAALAAGFVALGVPASASSPPPVYQNPGGGGWAVFSSSLTRVSDVVIVPTVTCSSANVGLSGQGLLIELQAPGKETAGSVRTACNGPTPVYSTTAIVNNVTTTNVLAVKPGDRVGIRVSSTTAGGSVTITNLNTEQSRTVTGDASSGFQPADSFVGAALIFDQGVPRPGPIASTPAVFSHMRAGYRAFGLAGSLAEYQWVNGSNVIVANPSALTNPDEGEEGSTFTLTFTP